MHHIEIRPLAARDSLEALTALLHRAYQPLAAAGMNFNAATQDAATTARRAAEGQCFVAVLEGRLVGTVTVAGPYAEGEAPWTDGVPWFRHLETAHFHQFAVDPSLQRQGLGRRLVSAAEAWALQRGYRRMVLDTAEPAHDLRALYTRLGYAVVAQVQWEGRSYRSVVMLKALDRSPLREQLQTMARYHLWATRRLLDAVDALPEDVYRRDAGLFFGSIHRTLNHLLLADRELWFRRFVEGVSPTLALDQEIEPDRVQLRQRLVEAALDWLPMLDVWPEARLQGRIEYRRIAGDAVSLPFAPTLAHVFNHGTHHRGQVSAAITAAGHAAPELDLVILLQEEAA